MDATLLAEQILTVLRKNGYPDRKVRLPYHQIYRLAVDNGFALAESLEILKRVHQVDSDRADNRILFLPFERQSPRCDSKRVDKAIRQFIRPILKDAGFVKNRGRNSWRLHDHTATIIKFRSFNSYQAEKYRCTTFSLTVHAGICLRETQLCPWSPNDVPELPEDHECHIRMSAIKPADYNDRCEDRWIWNIDADGGNVDEAVRSIAGALSRTVLPWIDRHLDRDHILQRFLSTEMQDDETEASFGTPYAPARASVICGILISRHDIEGARNYLSNALAQFHSEATKELLERYWELFTNTYDRWPV